MLVQCTNWKWVHWTKINISGSTWNLYRFLSNKTDACIDLIRTWQKNKFICSCLWKNSFQMLLNMKNINNFTQWKIESVDVTITFTITQKKHSLGAVRGVHCTLSIHCGYLLKSQSENKKSSWSVWIWLDQFTCVESSVSCFSIRFDYIHGSRAPNFACTNSNVDGDIPFPLVCLVNNVLRRLEEGSVNLGLGLGSNRLLLAAVIQGCRANRFSKLRLPCEYSLPSS